MQRTKINSVKVDSRMEVEVWAHRPPAGSRSTAPG